MKLAIVSAHAQGHIDPTLLGSLLNHLPNRVSSVSDADVVIVPVSHHADFQFNEELRRITKPVVLMDFMEYFGYARNGDSHVLGVSTLPINLASSREWVKLHQWVTQNPPALYFKRELFQRDVTDKVLPIEWPCTLPAWEIESEQAFNARPFQVFYNWGYSNALRPRLAGEIYQLMSQGKIEVISSFEHIDAKIHEPQPKWISIHSPHTHRTHINDILRRQAQSKMSVSLPGSGVKCFRSVEAPVHTIPVMVSDFMAWSFPWNHRSNCVKLRDINPSIPMAEQLLCAVNMEDLYPIYVAAQETIDKYRTHRYISEYVLPAIQKIL